MRWLLLLTVLLFGCPTEETIRVGADQTMKELGLAEYVLAAFEKEHKIKTRLSYAGAGELQDKAEAGDLDYVFVVSEATIESLTKQGIPMRLDTYAHEEIVLIGPWEDSLGRHNRGDAVEMMRSIARTNYKFLKGKDGSAEHARAMYLFRKSGDRAQPGSYFATNAEGVALVKEAIEARAFCLVKRSSLLQAAQNGSLPHRVYREAEPGLVLRMVIVEVHPAKSKSKRYPQLYDFIMSDQGKELVTNFGERRFGYPIFGPGAPKEGKGAGVPKLEEKKGLFVKPDDEE